MYDKSELFTTKPEMGKIASKAQELFELCTVYDVPMFLCCFPSSSDFGDETYIKVVVPDTIEDDEVELQGHTLDDLLRVVTGFYSPTQQMNTTEKLNAMSIMLQQLQDVEEDNEE